MEKRTCPHCGHENLPRAIFCFNCGTNLNQLSQDRDNSRPQLELKNAASAIEGQDSDKSFDLETAIHEAHQIPTQSTPLSVTCLRCGTPNEAHASYCMRCGATLSIPDNIAETHYIAIASARSDVGLIRDNNEDRIGLWARQGIVLALVADGMGGAVAGEEASRLVLEAIQADFLGEARGSETLHRLTEEEVAEKLRAAVRRANRAIIQKAREHPELQGMGTTITLAFVRDNRVIVAHVGDSRAYLVDGNEGWINQITDDHSFVEALVASGHITQAQAASHPMRNVLYRALGQVDDTEADLYSRSLAECDRLILCSDGLKRHVEPQELARLANNSDEPDAIADALIALARRRGGEDNISAVVILMKRAEDIVPLDPPLITDYDPALENAFPLEERSDKTLNKRDTRELPPIELDFDFEDDDTPPY